MTNNTIDINEVKKLEQKLETLDKETKDKILYSSIIQGAKLLVDATKQSLVEKMGASATRQIKKKRGGNYKPLIESIAMKGDKPYCEAKVFIYARSFLKWFETGTQIRKTSKGYNRGSITALNFFLQARLSNVSNISNAIIKNAETKLKKIIE